MLNCVVHYARPKKDFGNFDQFGDFDSFGYFLTPIVLQKLIVERNFFPVLNLRH